MRTDDFDFELPPELIAQHPVSPRDAARLLVIGETLQDKTVRDLPDLLRPGDLMVVNDTRVLPTRLAGRKVSGSGAKIEATLHKAEGPGIWHAFARPAKRLEAGDRIAFAPDFAAEVRSKGEAGEVVLDFACGEAELLAKLQRHGAMPLPPYIKRADGPDPHDRDDYQTVFAARPGAVAAPTAGLHFTPDLLAKLEARGVARVAVTLHVGAGTFLPVKSDDPRDHAMHSEVGEITAEVAERINAARQAGGRIVAVGSTPLRLVETACDGDGRIAPFAGETALFLLPGDPIRAVDLMLTNFHLPRSTLFMLVSAFAGRARMRAAYAHAIAKGYRFFSYGDACLIHGMAAP